MFAKQTLRKITETARARARVCVCVCVSLARNSSETIQVIVIKFGTVTALDMRMHHVLIILTLIFFQGHTDILHVRLFQFDYLFRLPVDKCFNLYFNSNISEHI